MHIPAQEQRRGFSAAAGICFSSCALTLLLLLAACAIRGLWPFGSDNVAYVDTAQFYVPEYYKVWDALHGASARLNWFTGLAEGSNMTFLGLTNPANYVFLLLPRDHILEGLTLYLAAYLLLCAVTTSLCVHARFGSLHPVWQLSLTLIYVFSGFVLQYYANFNWIWIAAVFPILMLALERLLRDGKYILYAAVYAYYLYYSVYFAYMATIYVLLFSFAYCAFVLPREQRGDRLLRLGLSTAAGYAVCARSWLADSAVLTGTSRFQSNLDTGLLAGISTWDITNTRHTLLMLLGTALLLAILLRAGRRGRLLPPEEWARRRGTARFFAFLLGALALPMVFTNIDAAWHFGRYNFFPMRYGYMLPATLIAAAGLALEREAARPAPEGEKRLDSLRLTGAAGIAAILVFLEPRLTAYFREYGACFLTALGAKRYWLSYFALYAGCGLLLIALYLLLLRLKNRRLGMGLIAAALLLQLGTNACGLLAPSDDHTTTREYDPAYIETADSLYEYFSEQELSPLSRFKNADSSLNAGYPAIAGVSSLASVNSANSALRLGMFRELGYTVNYIRILDVGGTVFSDRLLGVDTILTAGAPDESLYIPTDTVVDGIRISRARYPGVIGLQFPDGALDGYLDELTLLGRLNTLYAAFTGSEEALAAAPPYALTAEGEGMKTYTLTVPLDEASFLYLAADAVLVNIAADGRSIPVPTYQNTENTIYPAAFNSNLLYLGRFDSGTVTVTFLSVGDITEDMLTLTALRCDLIERFAGDARRDPAMTAANDGDGMTLTLTAAENGMRLFLPLTYSLRWRCTVNGSPVSPERTAGTMLSIPLQKGENTVTLARGAAPLQLDAETCISLAGILLCAAWLVLRRRMTVTPPRWAYTAAQGLFGAVMLAAAGFLYIAPILLLITRGSMIRFG